MPSTTHDPLLQRARSLTRERDYVSAVRTYQEVLAVDPDSAEAREGLAMTCFVSGDLDAACDQFELLTHLQPTEARHYVNWGAALNRQGKHREAADILRKAIQRNRKSADAYYNLGIAQRHLKQASMAVSAYKEAIRLDPQMAEAYQNLGNVYLEIGSHQLAVSSFQKALEVRPEFEKARIGLNRAEDAIEQARQKRNPFGRLVETQSQKASTQVVTERQLTDAERHEDRNQVWNLAQEIKTLGDACATQLKDRVERRLQAMTRIAADTNESPIALVRAAEEFREAMQQWAGMRQQLRRKILELRGHEELMNTPDLRSESSE